MAENEDIDEKLATLTDRVAAAILLQMRADIGRRGDWATEPERHREAFRRAAKAALLAMFEGLTPALIVELAGSPAQAIEDR